MAMTEPKLKKRREVVVLKGPRGSGKTAFAKDLQEKSGGAYKRISKDDLRQMLDLGKFSRKGEKLLNSIRDTLLWLTLQESDKNVIIDDMNLKSVHMKSIKETVENFNLFMKPARDPEVEIVLHDFSKPKKKSAVICDLDGTLALMGDRSPYDASDCENDEVNLKVLALLEYYASLGTRILFVTGRDEKYADETHRWLAKSLTPAVYKATDKVIMRGNNDKRKDFVVKREAYYNCILEDYDVEVVLDDRNQVVAMWRELGLTCFQVNDGDF